ncbi:MAG: GNAT family N-acetyltransferase [Proteobacteria bacterium]|nr:GNAT family N-acetyltransferase [Pseudomonadota bacterium]
MTDYQKADINDFLGVAALDRTAWLANRHAEFIPDGEHAWRHWVEHSLVFVAKTKHEILGAILAFPCQSGAWCVHKVFVSQDKRGHGIGSQLFGILLKEIDKIPADCFLTVDPVNEAALKLYEKWGFTEKEFVPGYYRPHEDRFVLTRRAI